MAMLHLIAAASVALALAVRQDEPSEPPATDPPAEAPASEPAQDPAGAPGGSDLKSVEVPVPAEKEAPAKPFTLGRTADNRPGKSPYAVDTQLSAPPRVYEIPLVGQMGTDIHGEINGKPGIYDKVIEDVRKQKPDIILFRIKSRDGRSLDKYMDAVKEQMKDDKIDPRRLASGLTEYRDLALELHTEIAEYPAVMYVEDARGIASLFALAWPYMFMSPEANITGLDIVASLGGGNDADIRAKMFSAWTGIAQGVLELGGHPIPLTEALVRPDRKLSCSIDGRATTWRADTNGDWYVVDPTDEISARFTSKVAEETGLTDGIAQDTDDLMYMLGYPEYVKVDTGKKIFDDYTAAWRKRFAETQKLVEEYQQPVDDPVKDLPKRKAAMEKVRAICKQYPPLARMWEWRAGLTDAQMQLLIENLTEQIKQIQKERRGNSGGGTGGGGGGRLGGGGGTGPGRG